MLAFPARLLCWACAALAIALLPRPLPGQCAPEEVAQLKAPTPVNGAIFGYGAAFDGERGAVTAQYDTVTGTNAGAVYLYGRDQGGPGAWGHEATLVPPDPIAYQSFGSAVALHADQVVVGAQGDDEAGNLAGALYVFDRDLGRPGSWGLRQKLLGAAAGSFLGRDLDMDAGLLAVARSGAVLLFERATPADDWVLVQTIAAFGTKPLSSTGLRVRIGENYLAVADARAPGPEDLTFVPKAVGAVYLYVRDLASGLWVPDQRLLQSGYLQNDELGTTLAVDGDVVVAGVRRSVVGFSSGAAFVFERDPLTELFQETAMLYPSSSKPFDWFAYNGLDLDDGLLLVGANGRDASAGQADTGVAFLFERLESGWVETHRITNAGLEAQEEFGRMVALHGRSALVGAPGFLLQPILPGRVFVFEDLAAPAPASYCTAGTSQNGCQGVLSAAGFAHLSAPDGFRIDATGLDAERTGILFWGLQPQANPWGGGGTSLLCVVPPVVRTPAQDSGGTPGACDGALTLDFNAWMAANPSKAPAAGTTVHAQGWYRDPGAPADSSMTDALTFAVCP